MKKVLVTGSAGLVGSACVEFFAAKKWAVVGIDNNGRSKFFNTPEKTGFLELDIRDEGMVNWLFNEHQFDAIIHAAAQPSHDYATGNVLEDFDVNARGTVILLEAARKYAPDAVFVHVSTDKVYGENMVGMKLSDEGLGLDFAGIRSFFGCSKAAADMYAQEYANRFGMKVGIFRPGCITGKSHEGAEQHGFLAYLAKTIKDGRTYKIFGDGLQVRDQIHALDLASAFYEFIKKPLVGGIFNIGGGRTRAVSVLGAAKLLSEELGKEFKYEIHEPREGDRYYDVHDVSRFRYHYPEWDYQYSLQDIIKDVCSK